MVSARQHLRRRAGQAVPTVRVRLRGNAEIALGGGVQGVLKLTRGHFEPRDLPVVQFPGLQLEAQIVQEEEDQVS